MSFQSVSMLCIITVHVRTTCSSDVFLLSLSPCSLQALVQNQQVTFIQPNGNSGQMQSQVRFAPPPLTMVTNGPAANGDMMFMVQQDGAMALAEGMLDTGTYGACPGVPLHPCGKRQLCCMVWRWPLSCVSLTR